jgi:hypothetical protein
MSVAGGAPLIVTLIVDHVSDDAMLYDAMYAITCDMLHCNERRSDAPHCPRRRLYLQTTCSWRLPCGHTLSPMPVILVKCVTMMVVLVVVVVVVVVMTVMLKNDARPAFSSRSVGLLQRRRCCGGGECAHGSWCEL